MEHIGLVAHFGKPKAKIDFITLRLPASIRNEADALRFSGHISGRITAPKAWWGRKDDCLTIHDPTRADLQFLIDEHHDTEILALEVAVDFFLKDGCNDPARLRALHAWLKTRLFPQRHDRMKGNDRRKYYDEADGTIKDDTLKTRSGDTTLYWPNTSGYEQVRLYIKTTDDKRPIDRHCVRIEATLHRGGCQYADVHRVGLLPHFADNLRRYLSPFFNIAAGIKPKIKRTRTKDPAKAREAARIVDKERARAGRNWTTYGAAWAAKYGYRIIQDTKTNRLVGVALKGLRDSLTGLSVPAKVADWPAWVEAQTAIYQGIGDVESGEV
jgi:hypothetical protein